MKYVFLTLALVTKSSLVSAQAPENLESISRDTGTETVRCQSRWWPTEGEADRDCSVRLERATDRMTRVIEGQGRTVTRATDTPFRCTSRQNPEYAFRCSGSRRLAWVDFRETEAFKSNGDSEPSTSLPASTPSLPPSVDGVRPEAMIAAVPEAVLVTTPGQEPHTVIVLEDELKRRFRNAFTRRHTSMSFDTLSLLQSTVRVGDEVATLPLSVGEANYVAINNTNVEQDRDITLRIDMEESRTIEFRNSFSRNNTIRGQLSAQIAGSGLTIGGESTASVEFGSTDSTVTRKTRTYEQSFTQSVPPMSTMYIRLRRTLNEKSYVLEGSVLVDGVVRVNRRTSHWVSCGLFGVDRCKRYRNRTSTYRLSQFLNEEQRRFDMSGIVRIASSNNVDSTIEYSIEPIPTQARSGDGLAELESQFADVDYLLVDNLPGGLTFQSYQPE